MVDSVDVNFRVKFYPARVLKCWIKMYQVLSVFYIDEII